MAVCDAVQKKKRTSISIPAIFKVLEIPVTKGAALREIKLETIPALRYRASGSGPPGRPTGVL